MHSVCAVKHGSYQDLRRQVVVGGGSSLASDISQVMQCLLVFAGMLRQIKSDNTYIRGV